MKTKLVRAFYIVSGLICLALGIIGIFLPLMPTTVFILLSAFFFARSSDALHDWLLAHPRFGKPINDWRENGAISKNGKILAMVAIVATFGISLLLDVSNTVLYIQAVVLACVSIFIVSRPSC